MVGTQVWFPPEPTLPGGVCSRCLGSRGSIVTGDDYSCVTTSSGGVKCWGLNALGSLGDGTTTFRPNPVDVCASGSGAGCGGGSILGSIVAIATVGEVYLIQMQLMSIRLRATVGQNGR